MSVPLLKFLHISVYVHTFIIHFHAYTTHITEHFINCAKKYRASTQADAVTQNVHKSDTTASNTLFQK